MIPKENYEILKRLNEQLAKQLLDARKENEKMKGQIELLKNFSLIGEFIKWNTDYIQSEIKKSATETQ